MREIKFRVWEYKDKKMYEVITIRYKLQTDTALDISQCVFVSLLGKPGIKYNIKAMPSEISFMQYTGLKDKNGKEIYEKDIIQCRKPLSKKDDKYLIAEILEMGYEALKVRDNSNHRYPMREQIMPFYYPYKVIGNIYENPELMETE